jgi:hypothetical protein
MKPCYHGSEPRGSANFTGQVWIMARADSYDTMNLSELAGNTPSESRL